MTHEKNENIHEHLSDMMGNTVLVPITKRRDVAFLETEALNQGARISLEDTVVELEHSSFEARPKPRIDRELSEADINRIERVPVNPEGHIVPPERSINLCVSRVSERELKRIRNQHALKFFL